MSDADESFGQDVQEEASKKLDGVECHDLLFASVCVVFPGEGDLPLGEIDDAVVRDRDPMGVATEVVKDVVWPAERSLCENDPVLRVELVFETFPLAILQQIGGAPGEIEFSVLMGSVEHREELPSEEFAEDLHGQEVVFRRRDPALTIKGQPSASYDAMEVRVEEKILSPRVKDSSEADLGSEMLLCSRDCQERLRCCGKEDLENGLLVAKSKGIESVGDREDDVKIRDGEQSLESLGHPLIPCRALALGAVSVSARVVRDALMSAGVALLLMATQSGCAAFSDAFQHRFLGRGRAVSMTVVVCVDTHHVGDLETRPILRGHDDLSGLAEIACFGRTQKIERTRNASDVLYTNVSIDFGRTKRPVAKQSLDDSDVDASF